jgi:hypothetical protein
VDRNPDGAEEAPRCRQPPRAGGFKVQVMEPDAAGPARKRSRWWPLNLRWVQIAIIAAIALYTVNFIVAIMFPGTQV